MTFTEAMNAAFDGKKVRRSVWITEIWHVEYCPSVGCMEIYGDYGQCEDYCFHVDDWNAGDWEIVK